MRVVFFGTPQVAARHLEALIQWSYPVVGVVSQPDRPKGRGLQVSPTAVKETAQNMGISPILQTEKLKTPQFIEAIAKLKSDLGVVVAYGKIIPQEILQIPKLGFVNVHFSLLPQLRGPSPVETAILWGLEKTGVTIFWITEKMDAGPIISQEELSIGAQETAPELKRRLVPLGIKLLKKALEEASSRETPGQRQEESLASYSKIIKKEDGFVSWEQTAQEIERKVLAFAEWPKARGELLGKNIAILKAKALNENDPSKKPGEITRIEKDTKFVVKCSIGSLLVERVHPDGKKPMSALDFLRGIRRGPLPPYRTSLGEVMQGGVE